MRLVALAAVLPMMCVSGVGHAAATSTQNDSGPHTIFYDSFSGPPGELPPGQLRKWEYGFGGGGHGNNELELYTSSAVGLDGHGDLRITAQRKRNPDGKGFYYESGKIETIQYPFVYGHVEARIRVPAGQGLWPAFWMIGVGDGPLAWPASGEIDAMEAIGRLPHTVFGSIHGPLGPETAQSPDYTKTASVDLRPPLSAGYHVYAVDASPGVLKFSVDGLVYQTLKRSDMSPGEDWVYDRPFKLILNLAVGGSWPGVPNSRTHFPASMYVDYVKITATQKQEQQSAAAIRALGQKAIPLG